MDPIEDSLTGKRLTRREFLRAAGVAAGASVLGPLVAACGGVPTAGPAGDQTSAAAGAPQSAAQGPRTDIFMQVYSDYEEMVRNKWVLLFGSPCSGRLSPIGTV